MLSGARSAGDVLRQRRDALGLDRGEVAAALRIKPAYLEALEAGRTDQLPGPTYAIGFMRAYADHLGLDSGEVLRLFKQESAALAARQDLSFPMPLGERSLPGGGMLLVALILAICGYGTWYYLSTGERSRPERVAEVPAELLPPQSEQRRAKAAASRPAEAWAAPPVIPPVEDADAPSDAVGAAPEPTAQPDGAPVVPTRLLTPAPPADSIKPSQDATQTAGTTPAPSPSQSTPGAAYGSARIIIRATADSWVQIRDSSRSVVLARLLKAGESYPVPDQTGLSMRTGNAGGLEITVDTAPAPPIGRMGMVRNVALDPKALAEGSAVRE